MSLSGGLVPLGGRLGTGSGAEPQLLGPAENAQGPRTPPQNFDAEFETLLSASTAKGVFCSAITHQDDVS
jgi:hypothetical protein